MENTVIPVFVTANDAYCPLIATTIISIMENTKENVHLYVLSDGIQQENQLVLKNALKRYSTLEIEFYDVNTEVFTHLTQGWFSNYTTYMRYLIADMFPNIDKAIYTDVDIIFNTDIGDIFAFDPAEKGICAAKDEGMYHGFVNMPQHKQQLGIPPKHTYFNAGLLVINLAYWRKEGVLKKLFGIATQYKDFIRCPSQDPLNIYFSTQEYIEMPKEYNFMPWTSEKDKIAKVYHFTLHKPWLMQGVFGEDLFWKYARLSPWYEKLFSDLIQNKIDCLLKKMQEKRKMKKYRLLSKITIGKTRQKYKQRYKQAKNA